MTDMPLAQVPVCDLCDHAQFTHNPNLTPPDLCRIDGCGCTGFWYIPTPAPTPPVYVLLFAAGHSGPPMIGPFTSRKDANDYAVRHLNTEAAAVGWTVGLVAPPVGTEP